MNNDLTQLALDYLYGLHDEPEAESVRQQLETPAGQVAMREAERLRAMISSAARMQFPDVRFTIPSTTTREQAPSPSRRWIGWVVAASFLGALSIPGISHVLADKHLANQADQALAQATTARNKFQDSLTKWNTARETAQNEFVAAQAEYQRLYSDYITQLQKTQQDVRSKQFNVVVSGPAALTPGAPNQYQIETLNTAGQRTAAKLTTRVVDQVGRVVYEPPTAESRGVHTLLLPADLPLTPERELALEVTATNAAGPAAELKQKLPLAPPIYFAHLSTDKPMYQPTESVRFRALVLDRFKLQPPTDDLSLTLSILDPQGSELVNIPGINPADPLRGIAAGEFALTESAPGGEYTLRLKESTGRLPDQTRKFLVNRYRPDQLQKELEFTRKSYGAGDEVGAACNAKRINGPVANQPVEASAQVDGTNIPVEHAKTTDAKGNVLVKFKLPAEIQRGNSSITVKFTDGATMESIVKPVPVVVNKLAVEFYPEGGDLIAGVQNRVYVQARTPIGKPAQMRGRVIDKDNAVVAEVQTLCDDAEPGINQGQGRFAFTPKADATYRLMIDNPAGIKESFALPKAKGTGVVLDTGTGVFNDTQPLSVYVTNVGPERSLIVGAYARGRLLAHERITATSGQQKQVSLQPTPGFGGVTRVTVFEERGEGAARQLVPLAERLVFRKVTKKVNVAVAPDKMAYAPGEKVQLKVTAKDEQDKAVQAVTVLGVVNQSVVTMADEKTFRFMPTHFLLTAEVEKAEDLEHVDVLLGTHAKAETALDLLLGVQGWRRFAEKNDAPVSETAVARKTRAVSEPLMRLDSLQAATKLVADERRPAMKNAELRLVKAQSAFAESQSPREDLLGQLRTAVNTASYAVTAEQVHDRHSVSARELGRHALPWIASLGGLTCVVILLLNLVYGTRLFVGPIAVMFVALVALGAWMMIPAETSHPSSISNSTTPLTASPFSGGGGDQLKEEKLGAQLDNLWAFFGDLNGPEGRSKDGVYYKFLEGDRAGLGFAGGQAPNFAGGPGRPGQGISGGVQGGVGGAPEVRQQIVAPKVAPEGGRALGRGELPTNKPADGGAPPPPAGPRGGAEAKPDAAPRAPKAPVPVAPKTESPLQAKPRGEPDRDVALKAKNDPAEVERRRGANIPPGRKEDLKEQEAAKPAFGKVVAGVPVATKPAVPVNDFAPNRFVPAQNPALQPADAEKIVDRVLLLRELNDDEAKKALGYRDALTRGVMAGRYAFLSDLDIAMNMPHFIIREYAHIHKPSADGMREDFAETVFWHPAIVVPKEGTQVSFDLSDAVSRYRILAEAHTLDGRLGANKTEIAARKPLTVEPKIPVEITAGDRIDIPVSIANETDSARDVKLNVETQGLVPVGPQPTLNWKLNGNSRERRLFGFRPLHTEGQSRLRFALQGDDAIEVRVPVVAEGFPIQGQFSDELRGEARHSVSLPKTWVPGTLKCDVALFPTPLADLVRGLDGLLRDPYGCFEQTSTTNYPNTLILDYLRETGQANPEAVSKAKAFLDKGYSRLTSFEVPQNQKREGYEWFGHAPAHEALTAYGLLQFRDMARVTDVDQKMIDRTRTWLMSRKDGQGGFQRAKAALDSFGRASESVTNAYIVWAITESGKGDDVTMELNRLENEARTASDPYFLALVANALLNRDRAVAAYGLLDKLMNGQAEDGSLTGTQKSITGSQGQPLKVETTALSVLGWLKANRPGEYSNATRKAVKWISQQRRGQGDFGPTQSTIMALKSLVAFARAYKQPPEAGTMTLRVGDQVVTADYTADRQEAIVLEMPDAEKWLKPGDNTVTITTNGKNFYPYTLGWSYRTLQPPSTVGCAVKLTTKLDKDELAEGDSTRLLVNLENVSQQGQGMTVAIVGLPAGMKLPDDFKQLREMSRVRDGKPGPIGFFEVRGRELVLYWRDLAPDAKIELALDVIANVPGKYLGPASRAYLYYDPEAKFWTNPMTATVKAKE